MGITNCHQCASPCCRMRVDLNRAEYDRLVSAGHASLMTTATDRFMQAHPEKDTPTRRLQLDAMHERRFAEMTRGDDGLCVAIDSDTRLCTIYEDRPSVCKKFTLNLCAPGSKVCQREALCTRKS